MFFNLNKIRVTRVLLRNITMLSQKQSRQYCSRCKRTSSSEDAEPLPWKLILEPCFTFTDSQKELCLGDPKIIDILAEKTERKEFYYGLETKPMDEDEAACLDFNKFLPYLPDFISIVWTKRFSEFIETTTMENVPNVQLIRHLNNHIPAMAHMTVYKLNHQHLDDFLETGLNNVLIIRGDHFEEDQEFKYAFQAVEYLRSQAGDRLCIAVGGYPQGHTSLQVGPVNKERDMEFLKMKMDAGADYIVTQLCYSGDRNVEWLQECRDAGICCPIVLGILIPETYARYIRMTGFSKVVLSPEALEELEKIKEDDAAVQKYFVDMSVRNIQQAINADLGVAGVHFYTLNRFTPVLACISDLRELGILKATETNVR